MGKHHILKFVHNGNAGQTVYRIDLRDGTEVESKLPEQIERFRPEDQGPGTSEGQRTGDIFLLYDGTALTAWVRSEGP